MTAVDFGLFNPNWPWLGCSPDAVIYDSEKTALGCTDRKCPYTEI